MPITQSRMIAIIEAATRAQRALRAIHAASHGDPNDLIDMILYYQPSLDDIELVATERKHYDLQRQRNNNANKRYMAKRRKASPPAPALFTPTEHAPPRSPKAPTKKQGEQLAPLDTDFDRDEWD